MSGTLEGKNIVLCVTGGIAAYKAADLTSGLYYHDRICDTFYHPIDPRGIV